MTTPLEEVFTHVSKTRIGGTFIDTDRSGKAYLVRVRLGTGIIKANADNVRKLIQMVDELPVDGSAPRFAITSYVNSTYVAFGWAGVERDRKGEWDILFYPTEPGSDFDLVSDYVHNLQQKRTTLFWELLTRVDQK